MNTNSTAAILSNAIDRHSSKIPAGKLESHDLDSLSKRVLAPRDVLLKLLSNGVLQSQGPVHANDETGMQSFASDDLNAVRTAVLQAIVERTVDESDGDPTEIEVATGQALRDHLASFAAKPGAKREFCRFPRGVVQLARRDAPANAVISRNLRTEFVLKSRGKSVTELETFREKRKVDLAVYRSPDDEDPTLADRATNAVGDVAKVAGAGAALYGGLGYLRGRMTRPANQLPGIALPGAKGVLADTLAGIAANNGDVKRVAGSIGKALTPGAQKVADLIRAGRMTA